MSVIKTFVKRPVTTTMVILIFVSFGILSLFNLNLDMYPDMDIPVAIVSTNYSGAASEEMENLVTKPLEGVLGTVPGVSSISSTSSNGSSIVVLEFDDGVDIDQAALDMREKVDLIKGFLPDDASDPMVMKIDINALTGSTSIGIKGKNISLVELENIVEDKVLNRLERQEGVASISSTGGSSEEIKIQINEEKLRGYGISEGQLVQILYSENINTPTGTIKQGNTNLSLRVEGQFAKVEDIRNIPITTPTGGTIFLRDVAEVSRVNKDVTEYSYIDGEPGIILSVQKQSTANTVNVSDALIKEIGKISREVEGIEIVMLMDPADYIRASISSVASSALIGGVLAVIILFIFLRDVRTTLIVGMAMPMSVIITFGLMQAADITINIMSLGGLTLGVGMLVDNSIVVIESIYRKMERGLPKFQAAVEGAGEVAMSVIASTLTTIVVFLPITFTGGAAAQIFNQLSFTISFALIASLFASLTFVPMASSLLLVTEEEKLNIGIVYKILSKFNDGFTKVEKGYKTLLEKAINHGKIVLLLTIVFLGLTGYSAFSLSPVMIPESDEGMVTVSIRMPRGTILDETKEIATKVSDIALGYEEVQNISVTIGGTQMFGQSASTDSGSLTINLIPKNERSRSAKEIEVALNKEFNSIAGANVTASAVSMAMEGFGGKGISITVRGDDTVVLEEIVNNFTKIAENIKGVSNISSSIDSTSPQANIVVDRAKAASYGVSSSAVGSIINTAVSGTVAGTLKIGSDELDLRIEQDSNNYNYINDIKNILVPSNTGISVPLYEIADVNINYPPVSISRENQQRYVTLTLINDDETSTGEIIADFDKAMGSYIMPNNYTWEYTGSTQEMNETFTSLFLALIMAVFLVYMVMAAEFESLIYPFIVMFSIPVAISGGLFGLSIVGENLSITSFLGMIMLSGLVINSAIVLIDYTNFVRKRDNITPGEALLIAGPVRLRPIIMSVLTTCLGLLPMATSNAEGAELMRGLAVLVIFGLMSSTIITLILIPVVYNSITTRNIKRKEKKEKRRLAKIAKYDKIKESYNN